MFSNTLTILFLIKKKIYRYRIPVRESITGHRTKCIWVEIEKKEKRFVGQRVVYDDGIKAYKTKCLRGFN